MSARSQAGFVVRKRRGDDSRHGTPSGANRHVKAGEDPCDACRAAKAEYDRRRRESDEVAVRNRMHAKVQRLALSDLKRAHEDEYRVLYLAHKETVFREVTS